MAPKVVPAHTQRLMFAVRSITSLLVLGVVSVATGIMPMRTYVDEHAYRAAPETIEAAKNNKPHRCDDRLEDLCMVRLAAFSLQGVTCKSCLYCTS